MTPLSWALLDTPVGPVSVGCSPAGVAQVRYGALAVAPAGGTGRPAKDADPAAQAVADAACRQLTEYFRGHRQAFDVAVDWTGTAGVQRQVLAMLASSVGYGHTISYGALARAAGLTDGDPARGHAAHAPEPPAVFARGGDPPQPPAVFARGGDPPQPPAVFARGGDPPQPPAGLAARTVGSIMAGNPIPVIVPCHRVVASDGLGGYSGGAGIEVKRWLLILEGSLPPTLDWQPMNRPG
jgi:methylated-DNA-[protein]-cysteine S-methyltransferase